MDILDTLKKTLKPEITIIIITFISAIAFILNMFLPEPKTLEAIESLKSINILSFGVIFFVSTNYLNIYIEERYNTKNSISYQDYLGFILPILYTLTSLNIFLLLTELVNYLFILS